MFLQRLAELGQKQGSLPPMYQRQRVRWAIQLDMKGNYKGLVALTGEGKKGDEGRELEVPHLVRPGTAVRPLLLCDRADYVLGIPQEGRQERTQLQRESFLQLVAACSEGTGEPRVKAVLSFLRDKGVPARDSKLIEPGHRVTFEVAGTFPTELPSVQKFWANYARASRGEGSGMMTCLVCGLMKEVELSSAVLIKGIPGGQTSGTALVSANNDAFESFGLSRGLTSPTCRDCAEAFANGLNALLRDPKSSLRVGDSLVWVFWTRKESTPAVDFLANPQPEDVRALLESPSKGKPSSVKEADFFATALSASGGRAVLRDHIETATASVQENLRRWFRLQALVDEKGEGKPLGIWQLCASLTHDVGKDMPAAVPHALVRAALTGAPLPDRLLHQAVRRNRAEQGVTRARAMLIKMVLCSDPRHGFGEEDLVTMQPENNDPAYLCGRLFAELENAQRAALGDPNSTIRDRYFGTASTAPGSVFGVLMKGSQAHLGKLRKENRGAGVAIEQRIEEIATRLSAFPATLTLRDQALFSLGYYHQRAAGRAEARARKAAKEEN